MFHQFTEEPGMTVRCVDCGMIMSAHEMLAHDCPAPGETRLLGELQEQTDADREPTTPPPAEQPAAAGEKPHDADPDLAV
jgi:predicted  nucleic acid-binding Zn-ribbon protein